MPSLLAFIPLAAGILAQEPPQPPRTGKFRGEIVDPVQKDVIMKVRMQLPDRLPVERTLGLIFVCHGFKGHENNSYLDGTVAALKRLGIADQYVVIAGKSKGDGWTAEDDGRFLRLYEWAKKSYPVDPRRLFLFGSSNGAAFVCRLGIERQDLVAGVVSYCGGFRFDKMPEAADAAQKKTEWYFVHGGKDRPENSRRACDELRKRGYRYVFRQIDGYGHTDIWDGKGHPDPSVVDEVRDDWAAWIHALRHKEMPPAEEPSTLPAAVRAGGAAGSRLIQAMLQLPDPERRLQACEAASRTLFGPEVERALAKLLSDESSDVRGAAARGLAVAANWRSPDAQRALMDLARNASATAADRGLALEALARAARLALLGNPEDRAVVWTLVQLLEDGAVRDAALAGLSRAAAGTFEGRPTASTPAEWKEWALSKLGEPPR
jgi:hypothetical protein